MRVSLLIAGASIALPLAAQQPAASSGEPWRIIALPQSSLVYARDGSLIGEIGRQWRTSISIKSLPKYVPQAFVAIEDQRFYQHDGVDLVGIAGALKDAVLGDPRGASTITQQLIGNMHPDIISRADPSIGRKLREQAAAREMEKHYTKDQILEAYLNTINFGHGWYGIEAASRHYFGKSASQLTLLEATTLAALPQSPVYMDPGKYPARNRERRNTVLARMADQKYITAEQARATRAQDVTIAPNAGMSAPSAYFVDVVRAQAERAGIAVNSGGFRIHTTLDPVLQRSAVSALLEGTAAVEARPGYRHATYANRKAGGASTRASPYLQGAVVALDAVSGDVRALVGGRDYYDSPFNRAVSGLRQPGSAFKPLVWTAAIEDSIPANAIVPDTAIGIPLENGSIYRPDNADRLFMGPMTIREALAKSRNTVAVQLAQQVTMDTVIGVARRLGLTTHIAPYPSSAIGASAVQPLDLVAAFTAYANLGVAVQPRFLQRVDDASGRTVRSFGGVASQLALDPLVAFIVRDMMRDAVDRGTASSVRRYVSHGIPIAGKTGTTNDNTDVWFVGMTPEIVAGVWLGFDTPTSITPGAAGGTLAAPIWGQMIARYYGTRGSTEWVPPAGLVTAELDRETGLLADSTTRPERRYTEYFLPGTEPGALRVNPWKIFRWGPIAF